MRGGIMVNSLGSSQMSYELTLEVNKYSRGESHTDVIVFYREYDRFLVHPMFAVMNENQAWGYDAPVIATDLGTAATLISCPSPTKKFFYVWDLEWLNDPMNVHTLADIYQNPALSLIARSKEHFDIISECWKKPVGILEGFDHEQLIKYFNQAGS